MSSEGQDDVLSELVRMSKRLGTIEEKMNAVPHERHNEEHEWLKMDIERKKMQRDFWIDVNKKLATAGIIGAVGLLLSALWFSFTQYTGHTG